LKTIAKGMNIKLLILFFLHLQIAVFAQQTGTPFITNYPSSVYKGSPENWDILQDNRGVMFFANNKGVLEYDGTTWQLVNNSTFTNALAVDSNGRIYTGSDGDFGYLLPDSLGVYQYISLKDKIPTKDRKFNFIWKIVQFDKKIFFQSTEKVFVLQDGKLRTIYPKEAFNALFLVNNALYTRENGVGLMVFKNNSFQLIEGGDCFADERIGAMFQYNKTEVLLVTATKGVIIYNQLQNRFYKPNGFESVDKVLLKHQVYRGDMSKSGKFTIGTLTAGIFEFNSEGKIENTFNVGSGILSNAVLNVYYDKDGLLWANTELGISLVQSNLPFLRYTDKNGLFGTPNCAVRFNNSFYLGTSQNLYVLKGKGKFENISEPSGQNWQLYPINEKLLLANTNGLFEVKENKMIPINKGMGFLNLTKLNNNPNLLLASTTSGLCLLEFSQNKWKIKNKIKGFSENVYEINQDEEGYFWVFSNLETFRIKLNNALDSVVSVMHCKTMEGLPDNLVTPYRLNSGEIVFGTNKGIYRYFSDSNTFRKHPDFGMITCYTYPFQQQPNGDIWFQEKYVKLVIQKLEC
jgi:ligand-binding sensor domain-containing protein